MFRGVGWLPTFWDMHLIFNSENSYWAASQLRKGLIRCPETSGTTHQPTQRNTRKSEGLNYTTAEASNLASIGVAAPRYWPDVRWLPGDIKTSKIHGWYFHL